MSSCSSTTTTLATVVNKSALRDCLLSYIDFLNSFFFTIN